MLAWKHVRALRDPEAWDAWLYRLTVRACYRLAKSAKRRDVVELHVEPETRAGRPRLHRPARRARSARAGARAAAGRPAGRDGPPLLPRPAPHRGGGRPRHPRRDGEVAPPPRARDAPDRAVRRRHGRCVGDRGATVMTQQPMPLERMIAGWMADEAAGAPEAVLDQILATTAKTAPRPRIVAIVAEPTLRTRTGRAGVGPAEPRAGPRRGLGSAAGGRGRARHRGLSPLEPEARRDRRVAGLPRHGRPSWPGGRRAAGQPRHRLAAPCRGRRPRGRTDRRSRVLRERRRPPARRVARPRDPAMGCRCRGGATIGPVRR